MKCRKRRRRQRVMKEEGRRGAILIMLRGKVLGKLVLMILIPEMK